MNLVFKSILFYLKISYWRRWKRMWTTLKSIVHKPIEPSSASLQLFEKIIYVFFNFLDILCIPEFYEMVCIFFIPNIRPLSAQEKNILHQVFGDKMNGIPIKLASYRQPILFKKVLAFVTFNTIHSRDRLSPEIFVHELTHIWQYQQYGSFYIFKALQAQMKENPYYYGGIEALYKNMLLQKTLHDFNFEQQAEIMEHYYLYTISKKNTSPLVVQVYTYYAAQVDVL